MAAKLNMFKWFKRPGRRAPKSNLAEVFQAKYVHFKGLLNSNTELLKIISDLEEKLLGRQIIGMSYIRSQSVRAVFHTSCMLQSLNALSGRKYLKLFDVLEKINAEIKAEIGTRKENPVKELILPYSRITKEMVDSVGGKSANLGEVFSRVKLPIPEGFAITTGAYDLFLTENDLVEEIQKRKMEIDPDDPETLNLASEEIQRLIISAPVPEELREAILSSYDQMVDRIRQKASVASSPRVSLRSSAIGEDSDLSFAGQYLSLLNVPRERLIQTYSFILGSLFTPRALSYRLNLGIRDEDVAMSVACLQMVDSVASGIAYSRHPFNLLENSIIITAVWGLGPYAVEGIITPDTYSVSKDADLSILETRVSHKPVQLVSNPEGGLSEVPVPSDKQDISCLSPEQIRKVADYTLKLENHYGCPQDVEWALDQEGRILMLQARPLRLETGGGVDGERTIPELTQYPVLVRNGAVASPGVGHGTAFQVHSDDDLINFPEGAVLVAKHSSPKYVVVMKKAQAVITDSGSVTGHMASLAREFKVPAILDAKVATSSIPTGMEVTVDAYSGRVYEGRVNELINLQIPKESHMKGTPVFEALTRVAEWIVPLHLVDPKSANFTPEGCTSLHDIMRFAHELSYVEMFQISDLVSDHGECSISLKAPIPLDLCIIDLGGGLSGETRGIRRVTPDEIVCVPFKGVLGGMLHEGLRFMEPRPVELSGFFSVMSEQMFTPARGGERFGDRSYAIISDKYLNFSSRVGYHYGVLDAYCGQTINKNYITFSFKGGAADDVRKNRRARAIAMILEASDFVVEVMGDRVDARLQKYDCSETLEKLDIIGRLLIFTRQMDMLMRSEASVKVISESFLKGNYQLDHGKL